MKYISPEGLKKLEQELEKRKTKNRKEIARRIEEAKSLGDLSENAEYSAAKEAQSFNEGRILELEDIIRDAAVIDSGERKKGVIQMGSVIEAELMVRAGKKEKRVFSIVGSQEADPGQGKISNESPLGKAFLDKKAGDVFEIQTPRGKMKYKIIKIK